MNRILLTTLLLLLGHLRAQAMDGAQKARDIQQVYADHFDESIILKLRPKERNLVLL